VHPHPPPPGRRRASSCPRARRPTSRSARSTSRATSACPRSPNSTRAPRCPRSAAACTQPRDTPANGSAANAPAKRTKISGTLAAATLETVGGSKVTCTGGATAGEYKSAKRESLTLALRGCKRTPGGEACQSLGAKAGEIATGALEGEVGFISGRASSKPVVGLDLSREGALITAECGAGLSKALLTVEGSVIGTVSPTGSMTFEETVKYTALGGLQSPERFEEGVKDTLVETLVTGTEKTTEQAGLSVTAKDTREEPMEIKTRVVA
jgi:hypothetical protein